ncbi:steroid delta-isomerase-like uncharacterized protein [Novosphingobium sp. SG751A]|uniref:ketosteroid isomerase-related protein n=1 Tax=Novosphingobium sp. SG751A TaxID=2587000 RepID=UPI0015537387|nr:ketosteroid isomerase-related protein [Novosphingobium sp. SG751A]NOW45084.1 steroid delta-isomerase-like uncharacterized protein [Novosphingobium sp. SG751A]
MNQNEALALLGRYYAAFNAGDNEAMLDCLTPDVAHDINQGARQVGKEAFRQFLIHMDRCYRERLEDIVPMADVQGERGAAEFTVHGQYLATDEGLPEAKGQSYVLPAGAFFSFRDGLIARVGVYYNLADWMRQVGA